MLIDVAEIDGTIQSMAVQTNVFITFTVNNNTREENCRIAAVSEW